MIFSPKFFFDFIRIYFFIFGLSNFSLGHMRSGALAQPSPKNRPILREVAQNVSRIPALFGRAELSGERTPSDVVTARLCAS